MNTLTKLTILVAMALPAATALAWEAGPGANACKDDVAKFCKDVKPGEGRIVVCLKAHEAELSKGCNAAMAEKKQEMLAAMADCKADAAKFCKGVKPGEGRIAVCLQAHAADLTPVCKAHFAQKAAPVPAK